ncbi:MAG: methyltransferase domain-containing protein [Sandaracinaceae bacterium]
MNASTKTLLLSTVLALGCGGGQDHASGHPGQHDHHGGHGGHAGHAHEFSDVERFVALFDDPARDEWQRPAEVVTLLELEPGMTVADVGAGTGYFLPHLSPAVGPEGRVLALDVEPAMVAHMQTRAEEAGLTNVEARVVAPDDPGLDGVDRVLIVDTWHHIEDRAAYAHRLRDGLREGGFVLVVDFTEDSPHGPPEAMRLAAHAVLMELRSAGFEAEILETELPYQYAVRARRP